MTARDALEAGWFGWLSIVGTILSVATGIAMVTGWLRRGLQRPTSAHSSLAPPSFGEAAGARLPRSVIAPVTVESSGRQGSSLGAAWELGAVALAAIFFVCMLYLSWEMAKRNRMDPDWVLKRYAATSVATSADADALFWLADAHARKGQRDEALAAARRFMDVTAGAKDYRRPFVQEIMGHCSSPGAGGPPWKPSTYIVEFGRVGPAPASVQEIRDGRWPPASQQTGNGSPNRHTSPP